MIAFISFVLAVLASPFKAKSRLEAENAVLRHQLIVLRPKVRGRAQPTNNDRWFLVQMYRWFPSILKVVTIIQPETWNGVTVAYRFLGQVVDIAKVVLQTPSILIRLFPVTSETFAKLFSLSSVLSRLVR
jgi:hypothetical protein